MKFLFYLPKCQLSIFFISNLLYLSRKNNLDFHIYVVLENHSFYSLHESWNYYIDIYKLNHLYIENYENFTLISYDDILLNSTIFDFLQNEIDSIFYFMPNQQNISIQNKKVMNTNISKLISFQKPIYTFISIESFSFSSLFLKKIKKSKKNKIFYYGLYLGEDERGVINKDSIFVDNYIKEYQKQIDNQCWNSKLEILYIENMNTLFTLFYESLINFKKFEYQQYIFFNEISPNIIPLDNNGLLFPPTHYEISHIEKYIQNYHKNLYLLHEKENIHKIEYKNNIQIQHYLKKTNEKEMEIKKKINYTMNEFGKTCILFIILKIIFVFIYFYFQNKNYLLFIFFIILYKFPQFTNKIYIHFKDSILEFIKMLHKNLHYDDITKFKSQTESQFTNYVFIFQDSISAFFHTLLNPTFPMKFQYIIDPLQSANPLLNPFLSFFEINYKNESLHFGFFGVDENVLIEKAIQNELSIVPTFTFIPENLQKLSFFDKMIQLSSNSFTVIGNPIEYHRIQNKSFDEIKQMYLHEKYKIQLKYNNFSF